MPLRTLLLLLTAVVLMAGVTIWVLNLGGPGVLMAALPLFTAAVLALRMRRK